MTAIATETGAVLRALHERDGCFVIPNPWDVGSARILASMGFEALATTSAGMAFALGWQEGSVSLRDTLDHCRQLVDATSLPVSSGQRAWGSTASNRHPVPVSDCQKAQGNAKLR